MLHVNKLHVGEDGGNFLLVWRAIIRLERVKILFLFAKKKKNPNGGSRQSGPGVCPLTISGTISFFS